MGALPRFGRLTAGHYMMTIPVEIRVDGTAVIGGRHGLALHPDHVRELGATFVPRRLPARRPGPKPQTPRGGDTPATPTDRA